VISTLACLWARPLSSRSEPGTVPLTNGGTCTAPAARHPCINSLPAPPTLFPCLVALRLSLHWRAVGISRRTYFSPSPASSKPIPSQDGTHSEIERFFIQLPPRPGKSEFRRPLAGCLLGLYHDIQPEPDTLPSLEVFSPVPDTLISGLQSLVDENYPLPDFQLL
jgi:hypothetical protein